jgi:hypothetical protein
MLSWKTYLKKIEFFKKEFTKNRIMVNVFFSQIVLNYRNVFLAERKGKVHVLKIVEKGTNKYTPPKRK